jgi:hypothetical protein
VNSVSSALDAPLKWSTTIRLPSSVEEYKLQCDELKYKKMKTPYSKPNLTAIMATDTVTVCQLHNLTPA